MVLSIVGRMLSAVAKMIALTAVVFMSQTDLVDFCAQIQRQCLVPTRKNRRPKDGEWIAVSEDEEDLELEDSLVQADSLLPA